MCATTIVLNRWAVNYTIIALTILPVSGLFCEHLKCCGNLTSIPCGFSNTALSIGVWMISMG